MVKAAFLTHRKKRKEKKFSVSDGSEHKINNF